MATRINIHGKDICACGYHENEKGKKFIKIVATLDIEDVQSAQADEQVF